MSYTVHVYWLPRHGARSVYVGVSCLNPEDRLRQIFNGEHSSPTVRRGGGQLAPDLYNRLEPFSNRYDADYGADELARQLTADGYHVYADPDRLARIRRAAA